MVMVMMSATPGRAGDRGRGHGRRQQRGNYRRRDQRGLAVGVEKCATVFVDRLGVDLLDRLSGLTHHYSLRAGPALHFAFNQLLT
jgi:hypothetical protein